MANRADIEKWMPALLAHEGRWQGEYQTVDLDGNLVDQHRSQVECDFPTTGPWHYVQRNRFDWADGKSYEVEFGGCLEVTETGPRVAWDTETFVGFGWVTEGDIVMLRLDRKDQPGVQFTEAIILAPDGRSRARTWHWFGGQGLIQRTLCNERRA